MAASTGFEVKGLAESVKLLGRADKELRKEAGKVVRVASKKLQSEMQSRIPATPGVRRRKYHAFPKGGIRRTATATKGTISLNTGRYPVAGPAEFGWNAQFVPYRNGRGRFMPQNAMKRRTFPIWRGNQNSFKFPKYAERRAALSGPGWIVQPVLRKRLGLVQQEINEGMFKVFNVAARRAGVPHGK